MSSITQSPPKNSHELSSRLVFWDLTETGYRDRRVSDSTTVAVSPTAERAGSRQPKRASRRSELLASGPSQETQIEARNSAATGDTAVTPEAFADIFRALVATFTDLLSETARLLFISSTSAVRLVEQALRIDWIVFVQLSKIWVQLIR